MLVHSTARFRFERLSSCSRTIKIPISFVSSFSTEVVWSHQLRANQAPLYNREKKISQPPDCADLVRMFMSILIWAKASDARYPAFSNGKQFILPDPRDHALPFNFTIDEVLYQKSGVRSRNTWVARLTTQNFSAPGEAPRVATTVDPHEGQQSKDDVQLSHSEPGPTNPP